MNSIEKPLFSLSSQSRQFSYSQMHPIVTKRVLFSFVHLLLLLIQSIMDKWMYKCSLQINVFRMEDVYSGAARWCGG